MDILKGHETYLCRNTIKLAKANSKSKLLRDNIELIYLILYFHTSKASNRESSILFGDYYTSLIFNNLSIESTPLLNGVMDFISECHNVKLRDSSYDFSKELIKFSMKVTYDNTKV